MIDQEFCKRKIVATFICGSQNDPRKVASRYISSAKGNTAWRHGTSRVQAGAASRPAPAQGLPLAGGMFPPPSTALNECHKDFSKASEQTATIRERS